MVDAARSARSEQRFSITEKRITKSYRGSSKFERSRGCLYGQKAKPKSLFSVESSVESLLGYGREVSRSIKQPGSEQRSHSAREFAHKIPDSQRQGKARRRVQGEQSPRGNFLDFQSNVRFLVNIFNRCFCKKLLQKFFNEGNH